MTFGLYFLASILLMIVGNSLYIPQYYAYSQVEFLLCDTLDLGQAKPGQILKTSRFLMKGYKFQRFVLDLQLLLGISSIGLPLELLVFHSPLYSNQ